MYKSIAQYCKFALLGFGLFFGIAQLWGSTDEPKQALFPYSTLTSQDHSTDLPSFFDFLLLDEFETETETDFETDADSSFQFVEFSKLFCSSTETQEQEFVKNQSFYLDQKEWPSLGRLFILFHCLKVHLA